MNLNIFWKPKKDKKTKNFTQKQEYDSDFLLPEDKEEIEKLAKEKSKHLKSVKELNHKIVVIQNSTSTLVPKFAKIHHDLRQKYQWYYNWHTKPYSHSIHWLVLLLYIISLPLVYFYLSPYTSKTKAVTYDFPRWEWANPNPTGNTLNKVTSCTNGSAWAVGESGTIIKSIDSGNTWTQEYTGVSNSFSDIKCIATNNIIAVGSSGIILQYGGYSWTQRTSGTASTLRSITALDSTHAIAVGGSGTIAVTTDAGQTWTAKTSGTANTLYSIVSLDSTHAVAVGSSGTITVSTDAGQTWTTKNSGTANNLNSVTSLDSNHVVAVGGGGVITVSTDAGQTWTTKDSGTVSNLNSVVSLDSTHAIAVGDSGKISVSADAGQTWTVKTSGTNHFYSVDAFDSTQVVTTAANGDISVSTDAGQTWTSKTSSVTNHLKSVVSLDSTHAIAVGENGDITASANAGQNWLGKSSKIVNQGLNSVIPLDSTHAVAVGEVGTIAVSTDAGQTWTQKNADTFSNLRSVTALDSTHAVAVGDGGAITVSADAGQTWNAKVSGTANNLWSVTAFDIDPNYVTAVGEGGIITTSTDGGQTWAVKDSGTVNNLYKVISFDFINAVAVGDSGTITVSYTGGQTWATKASGTTSNLRGVTFPDENRLIAVGHSGKITVSTDGGQTWATKASGTDAMLLSVVSLDTTHIIAVGESGTITISANTGQSWAIKSSGVSGGNLTDVTALDSTHAIAVGWFGSITMTSDTGQTWTLKPAITNNTLNSVVSFNSTNAIVVGGSATSPILLYSSPANATATKFLVKLPGQNEFTNGNPITGTPTSVQAGDTVTATIYAVDASNNLDVSNASWAGFTTTDPNDTNPGQIQLTSEDGICDQTSLNPCGIGTATFTFHTPGTWTVTASDVYSFLSSGTSSSITVTAGDPAKLAFSNLPSTLAAGAASSAITLNLQDQYGNATTSGSNKTIHLSTTSSGGKFAQSQSGPWSEDTKDITLASGSSSTSFYYLDLDTGNPTITAAETPSAGWTDATGAINVTAGTLSNSTLTVDKSSVSLGESLNATVTLKNSENVILENRTVQLQSSRNTAESTSDSISPSSDITDSNGVATFSVTPQASGSFTLTAYDQTDNLYVPDEQTISVGQGALSSISLESSANEVAAGTPFNITATLYDAYSNQLTSYTDDIHFSSSDSKAEFSQASHTFSSSENGKFTQEVKLQTSGSQSISASAEGVTGTTYVNVLAATTITSTTPTPSISPSIVITAAPTEEPKTLIETFQESPILQKIAKTLVPITATVATLGLLPLLIQGFPQGFHVLASLFPTIFTAAAARRRRKPWGIVYDSLTGKPVDLAVVRVFNAETERLVATKVTDQNGRFSFLLSKGKYYIKVTKVGYVFPPLISKLKTRQLSTRFGPQSDIYFGQSFVIGADDTNINLNIAIDPKSSTLSSHMKLLMWFKNGFDWFLIGLSYFAVPLMLLGAAFAGLATVIIPSRFNLYMSGFYVVLLLAYLIVNKIKTVRLGFVFDAKSRKPVANATVSIFDKEYNAIREIKTTDLYGHFAILAQKGQYYLTVQAKDFKFPSKDFKFQKGDKKLGKLYFGETINNKKPSFIKVSIPLDKT